MVYQTKRKYSWGGIPMKTSAQAVGEHLENLEQKHGAITKQLFLDSARPEESPMHGLFEWDDQRAAEKWRLQQANIIINSLRIDVVSENNETVKLNAFVNTEKRGNGKASFINIQKAMSAEDTRTHVLQDALRDLEWIRRKYDKFQWFSQVAQSIDDFILEQKGA